MRLWELMVHLILLLLMVSARLKLRPFEFCKTVYWKDLLKFLSVCFLLLLARVLFYCHVFLSCFPVQLWSLLSCFPKIALVNPFFNILNFLTFFLIFSDFFWLYCHLFLSDFDHFCHTYPKLLYLTHFFNFSTFWHFFWLLSTTFWFFNKLTFNYLTIQSFYYYFYASTGLTFKSSFIII